MRLLLREDLRATGWVLCNNHRACRWPLAPRPLVEHSSLGAPAVPAEFKVELRNKFSGLFILSGGFNRPLAETALAERRGDLVAFARPFLANPDLLERMRQNAPLNEPDASTFYTP